MLKIPTKMSNSLSLCISVLLFVGCVVCAFILPDWVALLLRARGVIAEGISHAERGVILALAYAVLCAVILADTMLFALLIRVRRGLVFTATSIGFIRGISWCCFLLAVVFLALGFYFYLSFAVAFFAVFLGMCIRVVKNVLEQAVLIKSENDLTV